MKSIKLWSGVMLFLALFLASVIWPWVASVPSPMEQNLEKEFSPPEPGHPMGFGENGTDVFSHILHGGRYSLTLSVLSSVTALVIGVFFGFLAAWYGGVFDFLLLRAIEIIESFPGMLLVVALASYIGSDPKNIFLVLVFNFWVGFAKLSRLLILRIKSFDYVQSAVALGAKTPRVLLRHILPGMGTELGVFLAQAMGSALLIESSLSFLGLGLEPGTPSWGAMLNNSREVLVNHPSMIVYPGLCIFLSLLAFQLIGDALRQKVDGRS